MSVRVLWVGGADGLNKQRVLRLSGVCGIGNINRRLSELLKDCEIHSFIPSLSPTRALVWRCECWQYRRLVEWIRYQPSTSVYSDISLSTSVRDSVTGVVVVVIPLVAQ